MLELSPEQVIVLGFVASALTLVLRLLYEAFTKAKVTLPRWAMLTLVYAVAQVLALLWFPQVFPPLPVFTGDPAVDLKTVAEFVLSFSTSLSAVLGFAHFIYVWLIERVKVPIGQFIAPSVYPTDIGHAETKEGP